MIDLTQVLQTRISQLKFFYSSDSSMDMVKNDWCLSGTVDQKLT